MPDLNKPAAEGTQALSWDETARPPRWYLWEGGFLVLGKGGGEVPVHAHHAVQVHVAIAGQVAIRTGGEPWQQTRGLIVRADAEHAFNAQGASGAMLFVDPESAEGVWLESALNQDITLIPDARLQTCVTELRAFWEQPLQGMAVDELIRHCVQALCAGSPPTRKLDPRVAAVLKSIRDSEDLRMSLESAAQIVHLSPGRFAHVFKEETGLPFRRYMLWRKVTRAMLAIGRERTLAGAAQRGDFADAAHLTRTFYQMFGIPPSVLMRGEFFEIPSPFTVAA